MKEKLQTQTYHTLRACDAFAAKQQHCHYLDHMLQLTVMPLRAVLSLLGTADASKQPCCSILLF
jgi:hypothetical protein